MDLEISSLNLFSEYIVLVSCYRVYEPSRLIKAPCNSIAACVRTVNGLDYHWSYTVRERVSKTVEHLFFLIFRIAQVPVLAYLDLIGMGYHYPCATLAVVAFDILLELEYTVCYDTQFSFGIIIINKIMTRIINNICQVPFRMCSIRQIELLVYEIAV